MELEYELYLAALRRPALRPVAGEWADALVEPIAHRTDLATARALAALLDGICLQALLTGGEFDPEYTREMLARVAEGAAGFESTRGPERVNVPWADGDGPPGDHRSGGRRTDTLRHLRPVRPRGARTVRFCA